MILATNIAETSITIPGIKYVIDCGKFKCRKYKPSSGIDTLRIETISQAQAWQRTGRAGRDSPGNCYRLYSKITYDAMCTDTVPEILRTNLGSVLLHIAALKVRDFEKFDFIDKPSADSIRKSANMLISLGALTRNDENEYMITSLGKQMVEFPLDPRQSRILVASSEMGCSEEILNIISLLSVENVFHIPSHKREEANELHKKFRSSEGDHIMLLKMYKGYRATKGDKNWCKENFIDFRNMNMVYNIRRQMAALFVRSQFQRTSCGSNTESIRKCLTVGLFNNLAVLGKDGEYRTV